MEKYENKTKLKGNNIYALLGFLFSLTIILAIPGFILSIFGLKYDKEYEKSREGLAIAGLVISIIVIVLYLYFSLSDIFKSGESIEETSNTICVSFIVDDKEYSKECGEEGFKVEKPADPEKEGYEFEYWSTEKDSTKESDEYNFDMYVNVDKKLYSVFTKNESTPSNNNNNNSNNNNNNNQNTVSPAPQVSRYEQIYNNYSNRLRSECPNLSLNECATLANEGVMKMAEYMYSASGTEGQYATYESWATKLYDVYLESAR